MTKKRRIILCICFFLLLAALVVGVLAQRSIEECRTQLTLTHYTLDTDLTEPIRILQLTDLHSHVFGTGNDALIELVLSQQPDLILMTGDMLDKSDENADVVCALIEALAPEYPVWYGYGNHETDWMERTGIDLAPILTEAGASVICCDYRDIEVNGQSLRIGGYHGYYRQPGMFPATAEQQQRELDFAASFEATDRFKLLLCHIPTAWLDWDYINKFPVDLVLCGHNHGGQIRLPLLGPLYAPYVGLFPDFTEGLFLGQEAACVLSRGLGSSPGIPRVNNLPEITVIDLIPKA